MRACVLALLVCLAAGCAGHQAPEASGLLVRRSQATYHDGVTFDAPSSASAQEGGTAVARSAPDPAVLKRPQAKSSDSPTLESTNSRLATALAALTRRPTAQAFVDVGNEYTRLGVLDEAETNFRQALKIDFHFSPAAEGLARVWRDWGLPQYGLADAYRAVAFAPRSASAENTLGTLLFALGNPDAARTHFEKASTLDPTAVYALNNLCYVAFTLGDGGRAASRCGEALALAPDETATRNNLALVYAAEGRDTDAAREFARASLGADADFNVGITHMARREYLQAVPSFEIACHAKPEVVGACAWLTQARKLAMRPAR